MMGGGFGGCTLNLVKSEFLEEFKNQIKSSYQSAFALEPEFIKVTISDGAMIIAN
jgi:galactokinase